MSLKKCSIIFDRPHAVYYSGETITGTVNLTLDKNKLCNALMINLLGMAHCSWSETEGTGDDEKTVTYTGNEQYFTTSNNLMAEQHMQTGTSDLIAGDHKFNFTIILPSALPSSYEGYYGYVRYTAKITLKRSFKMDLCYKTIFTVVSHIDLNGMPTLKLPILNETQKNFYFFCVKKGTLYMTVQIPFSGFVSGQYMPVTCNLKNDSKVKIECVKAGLIKTIVYTATHPLTKTKTETWKVARRESDGVGRGEEKTVDLTLHVPVLPPSSFKTSSVIKVKYELIITAVVSGMHSNLKSITPIIIGTIPIHSNYQTYIEQPTSSYDPSAPPAYNEMMPPSYEEAAVDKRMKESHEEWDHSNEFSPRYPVYNFDVEKKKEI
ncbi:arrestin domain-containing protein 3-like [Arctopsyche grandis]|uniref:arrestin domain-containing protein 3-like n=1 Tax=Arctopsyche grandis TaxID=121162 RepID=UPI00406DA402